MIDWLTQLPTRTWWRRKDWGWRYFLWRELWHFCGGVFIGTIGAVSFYFTQEPVVPAIFGGLLVVAIVIGETKDKEQSWWKFVVDMLMWWVGFVLPMVFA